MRWMGKRVGYERDGEGMESEVQGMEEKQRVWEGVDGLEQLRELYQLEVDKEVSERRVKECTQGYHEDWRGEERGQKGKRRVKLGKLKGSARNGLEGKEWTLG